MARSRRLSYAMSDKRPVFPGTDVSSDPVNGFLAALWPRLDAAADGAPYEFEVCTNRDPADPPAPLVYLDQITVWDCRRGIGSRLLRTALAIADEYGVTISLAASSHGLSLNDRRWQDIPDSQKAWHAWRLNALSQQELLGWYETLGFRPYGGNPLYLVRWPGSPMGPPRLLSGKSVPEPAP